MNPPFSSCSQTMFSRCHLGVVGIHLLSDGIDGFFGERIAHRVLEHRSPNFVGKIASYPWNPKKFVCLRKFCKKKSYCMYVLGLIRHRPEVILLVFGGCLIIGQDFAPNCREVLILHRPRMELLCAWRKETVGGRKFAVTKSRTATSHLKNRAQ